MPDGIELRAFPDATRGHVTIELWQNGAAVGRALLGAPETEKFIADLAVARAALTEPVAQDPDQGPQLEPVVDPVWVIPDERPPEGSLLALRHPGLGWLSFIFPDNEAASIAEWLTKTAPGAPPAA